MEAIDKVFLGKRETPVTPRPVLGLGGRAAGRGIAEKTLRKIHKFARGAAGTFGSERLLSAETVKTASGRHRQPKTSSDKPKKVAKRLA